MSKHQMWFYYRVKNVFYMCELIQNGATLLRGIQCLTSWASPHSLCVSSSSARSGSLQSMFKQLLYSKWDGMKRYAAMPRLPYHWKHTTTCHNFPYEICKPSHHFFSRNKVTATCIFPFRTLSSPRNVIMEMDWECFVQVKANLSQRKFEVIFV